MSKQKSLASSSTGESSSSSKRKITMDFKSHTPPNRADPETSGILSDNFGTLLDEGTHSDVVFLVKTETLKAHKNILSVRSEVFGAMFTHDMTENQTNEVSREIVL